MKQLVKKSIGLAIGVAMVAPLLMAPTAVNGSLGGFSSNAQGGQNAKDWGIPDHNGENTSGQNSQQSGNGQNNPGNGKGPDAGGHGGQNDGGQNSQSGSGQRGPGESDGKGPDAGGHGGDQTNSGQRGPGEGDGKGPDAGGHGGDQTNSGQRGPGEGDGKGAEGNGQNGSGSNASDGPTKNNSNNPDGNGGRNGEGSNEGEGPTKNNSNNPDNNGRQNGNGSNEGEGPTKNNSNNPDGSGNGNGNGNGNGSGSGSGSSSSSGGGNGNGGDYPPLDPSSDGQYDPAENGGDQQIPSGCAEAGSVCAQCVQHNENVLQFNRRYLHVAWSTTHQTLDYTKQAIAFGDGVSELSNTSLSWQLAGKPQILEAVASLRKTYDAKYRIYINNMEQAMSAMTQCETDNYSVQNLYQQFAGLYLDFVKARYQSPD